MLYLGKIKFCTCSGDDVNLSGHYWEYLKYDSRKNVEALGELMLPFTVSKKINEFNLSILTAGINDPISFDFDLNPADHDRFLISIKCEGNDEPRLFYGFEFNNGKWQPRKFDAFEWEAHHDAIKDGAIKLK